MSEEFSENTSRKRHNFICEQCDYKTSKRSEYDRHLSTLKHKNASLSRKSIEKYSCTVCDFKCSYKSDYERHMLSLKHKKREKNANNQTDETETRNSDYHCSHCNYTCRYKSLFDKHLRSSKHINQESTENHKLESEDSLVNTSEQLNKNEQRLNKIIEHQTQKTQELCEIIVKQNEIHQQQIEAQQKQIQEQQEQHNKQIQDLIPQLQQVTNINTNCNNKFNLNFFLNEQCKDAISIQNFIENLNIGIRELEHMGDVGYVKGMMSIFSETLGAMDIYKRPLHCTDLKRDTLYIKQGDTWTKDTEDKTELKKIVETVKCRNYRSLRLWEREHPEAFECDTQDNIDYMRISSESLGGFNSTDTIKLNKIIKHVVKEVYVK